MPEEEQLLARLPAGARVANGVPARDVAAARAYAAERVREVLGDVLYPGGLRTSPLGVEWSSDIDAHVHTWPEDARLADAGWLALDPLLARIGSRARGRWAVTDAGTVLGALDLHREPPPDPVEVVLARCRQRGEVRLREVLELRRLVADGMSLPPRDAVVSVAADIEAGLGGDVLEPWATGQPRGAARSVPPVPLTGGAPARWRARARRVRRALRPRVVVGFSGVDGSGKSTLQRLVGEQLDRAGVPVATVWARPGMRMAWAQRAAHLAKRVLRQDTQPGVRIVGAGEGERLASRSGMIGWAWTFVVAVSFLVDVWRQHLRACGVLLYDRHLLDALVTLDVFYAGVPLGLHRALVRRLMPRAPHAFYVDVSPEVAAARKPGDTIGASAVRRQLDVYQRLLRDSDAVVLDGTRPAHELTAQVVNALLAGARV